MWRLSQRAVSFDRYDHQAAELTLEERSRPMLVTPCQLYHQPIDWFCAEMLKGERAAFKFSPEYSYAQKGCEIPPPAGVPGDAALLFDIQLVNWHPAASVKVAGDSGLVFKRSLAEADSWETPRPPFDVCGCAHAFTSHQSL